MEISSSIQSGVTVLAVAGSMDAATVAEFDAAWKGALDAGAKRLVVDLGGVEYISSAGLRGILMLAKAAKARGARLAFCSLAGMVADMFRLSGFLTILKVDPDTASALAAMA